jgi:hypothetical protein
VVALSSVQEFEYWDTGSELKQEVKSVKDQILLSWILEKNSLEEELFEQYFFFELLFEVLLTA